MDKVDDVEDDVLDWRNLKSKRQKRQKFKDYQEELLQDIPGAASRTNTAMHAVIDQTAAGCENQKSGMGTTSEIRNQALIHYVARLANSNSDNDEFDFSFVQSLLENGADINTADKYGQTMFHEVARSWNVDVARFLISKGANINQQDKYGRAALHVSSAVDYVEMIEFLLSNDANISITTFGELQTPIHFAAKNDACQALKLLIKYGASIHCRDYQNRTPLQVAASMSRSKTARYLVELGAPTGVYDHNGEMTLSLLILKMPEVATIALDQFRSHDMINRKEYHFLNYVEGPRIYDKDSRQNKARSPLEVAIQHEQYGIVMHPVMQRLINNKWEKFGRKGAQHDLIINVIFAFVWTILGITMPRSADQLYSPLQNTWWRLAIAIIAIFLTGLEMFKQVANLIYMNRAIRRWKAFRQKALQNDKRFSHPQWKDENDYLEKEIKIAEEERLFSRQDGWIFLDWIALLLIVAGLASHIAFFVIGSKGSRDVHVRIVAFLLIVFWVRLLKFTRPFKEPGPFVASIAPMLKDFVKWSILFCLLYIPYAAIFWMIFGEASAGHAESAFDIPWLLFTVFTMAAFSNLTPVHDFEKIDKDLARLLASTFVAVSTIITLNLLIAMLADTFTRMYENSLETATMQRAKTILYLEQTLTSKAWTKYCEHIINECSPEVTCLSEDVLLGKRDKMRLKETLHRNVDEIHSLVSDRFAQRVGNEKSDMDRLLEGVNMLNGNLGSMLHHAKCGQGDALPENASVLNLNIVLEQPKGRSLSPFQAKAGRKRNRKISTDIPQSWATTKGKGGEIDVNNNIDTQKYLRSLSISSDLSSHGAESQDVNNDIRTQINNVLDLMKQAVKNGNINLGLNGKTIVDNDTTMGKENADHSPCGEETETSTSEDISPVSEKDWVHYETQVDSSNDVNVMLTPVLSMRANQLVTGQQSSLDASDACHENNGSRSQSPAEQLNQTNYSLRADMRRVLQNECNSSSNSSNTTCDDTTEGHQDDSNTTSGEMESIENSPNEVMRETYLIDDIDSENRSLSCEMSDSHGNESETDTSSQRTSNDLNSNRLSDITDNDDVSSSVASDVSNQYLSDNVVSPGVREISFEYLVDIAPRHQQEGIPRTSRVTWADDAENYGGIPFLNIREITTSPSEKYSSDNHTGECNGSDEDDRSDESMGKIFVRNKEKFVDFNSSQE